MKNRLLKLKNDDKRLERQIEIANRHTNFHTDVVKRKIYNLETKAKVANYWKQTLVDKYAVNQANREELKVGIQLGKESLQYNNKKLG
jgi:hypothetical protein